MPRVASELPPCLLTSQSAAAAEQKGSCERPAPEPTVFAIFNVAMVGHVNPTLPLVQELRRRGCRVHYFLPPDEAMRAAAQEAGAVVEAYHEGNPDNFALERCGDFGGCVAPEDKLAIWPLASTLLTGEHILQRCRELRVRAVVYDPMAPHGLLVARSLGVPSVSLVTYPGVGCLATMLTDGEKLARWVKLRQPLGQEILQRFGVDLECELESRVQFFSEDTNLVTTSEALATPLPPPGAAHWADEVRAKFPLRAVGCMASADAPHVTGSSGGKVAASPAAVVGTFPETELAAAGVRGARVVYAAMGTMAVHSRWAEDISGLSSGGLPPGTTGKAFCQHVWTLLFSAMQELGSGYHCFLSVGHQPDALDFLQGEDDEQRRSQVPDNVTLRSSMQQVVMLSDHAHAFVTHAGFNSLQESLIAGVPLVALPQAVDQPTNARTIEARGWGRAFMRPMEASAGALAAALREVAAEGSVCQAAAAQAGAQLRGGQVRAGDVLVELAG